MELDIPRDEFLRQFLLVTGPIERQDFYFRHVGDGSFMVQEKTLFDKIHDEEVQVNAKDETDQ